MSINWLHNDGGPLVILPCAPPVLWEGGTRLSGDRIVEATFRASGDPATDYDRACDVDDSVEMLNRDSSWILVLGGVVQAATWIRLSDDLFLVVSEDSMPDSSESTLLAMYEKNSPTATHLRYVCV